MEVIWKFRVQIILENRQTIRIPKNSKFLSVISQDNAPVLYFVVDPDKNPNDLAEIGIYVVGTGQPCPEQKFFCGTVTTHKEEFVWHIFMDN